MATDDGRARRAWDPLRAGAALHRLAFTPTDIASLAALRIALGVLMFAATVRFLAHGWVDELLLAPTVHLPYWLPGFDLLWVEPLPPPAMHALFGVMAAASILVAIGLWYRVAIVVLTGAFVYVELVDATNYLNHYYAITLVLVLFAVIPAHAAWSVDAARDPALRRDTLPSWMRLSLCGQLAVIYVFAGVAKLGGDWLDGTVLHMWLRSRADVPIVGPWLAMPAVATAMAIGGTVFDLLVAPALVWRRTRRFAWVAVVGFHTVTGLLFPIGMFPWFMIALSTAFFEPSWPRILARTTRIPPAPPGPRGNPVVLAILAVHFTIQLLVPLRGLVYAGNVHWHEQGMRWSWRVMVVEKTGIVAYVVTEPATGRTWHVDPAEELMPRQAKMMATQPDLIVAYARHLHRRFAAQGHDVEVRADAFVALNGRPSRRFIDPAVDLAAVELGLGSADFVLPSPDVLDPFAAASLSARSP